MSVYPDNFSRFPWEKPLNFKGTQAQWEEEYNEQQALYVKKESTPENDEDEEPIDIERQRRVTAEIEKMIQALDESLKNRDAQR